jgi:hypothetical protein
VGALVIAVFFFCTVSRNFGMNLCDLGLFTELHCISMFIIKSVHLFDKIHYALWQYLQVHIFVCMVIYLLPHMYTSLVQKFRNSLHLLLS